MYRVLPIASLLIPLSAFGQDPPAPHPTERTTHHEISFRGRVLTVPAAIFDAFYFSQKDDDWPLESEDRPTPQGYAVGLEYTVKGDAANGIFYFEYMGAQLEPGYWDDRENPPDHLDGSYLEASANFGFVAIGADYAHEVQIVRTSQTDGIFGLTLLPGAGLGVAIVTGEVLEWRPNGQVPAFTRYANGEDPDSDIAIPPVLPMVDINLALRFNFADRAVVRLEGGLHDALYYGATAGVMF